MDRIDYQGWQISVYRAGIHGGYEAIAYRGVRGEPTVSAFRTGPGAKKAAMEAVKVQIDPKQRKENHEQHH